MSKFFDALETRTADERKSVLATRLPQQIEHAKGNTAYFAESLKHIDATALTSAAALAALKAFDGANESTKFLSFEGLTLLRCLLTAADRFQGLKN